MIGADKRNYEDRMVHVSINSLGKTKDWNQCD